MILAIAVLLICVGFSGCIDRQSESDYVTIQGILITAQMDEKIGFYIMEGMSSDVWLSLWNESYNHSDSDSNWTTDSIFILTRNGEMISHPISKPSIVFPYD